MKEAAAAIIQNEARELLLLKRGVASRNEKGKWENLGGAVNQGESSQDCIRREAKEEIGVELDIKRVLFMVDDGNGWLTTLFLAHIASGVPEIQEPDKIEEIKWHELETALSLNLASYTRTDLERIKSGNIL